MAYREAMRLLRKDDTEAETHMTQYLKDIEVLYQLGEEDPLPERFRTKKTAPKTEDDDE